MMTVLPRPIRVCFETLRAYPLFESSLDALIGGAEVDLYYLSTELAKDDCFDVRFIVGDYGQAPETTIENVRLIRSINPDGSFVGQGLKFFSALKRADADIYLRKGLSLGAAVTAWFCRRHKRPFVLRTAHSRECDGSFIQCRPVRGRAARWAVNHADAVLVQNDSDAFSLQQITGIEPQVIRNGHRLGAVSDHSDREFVLWVGRSIDFKHPERFLDLARSCSDQRFVMICQPAAGDRDYDTLRHQACAIDNLEFIRSVRFSEIGDYFRRASVFVNTSDQEGFPNTFIQAATAGTPILSWIVNPDGFLDRHGCGRSSHADAATLMTNLSALREPATWTACSQAGRVYVKQHHDIHRIVETYKTLFIDLMNQRESR